MRIEAVAWGIASRRCREAALRQAPSQEPLAALSRQLKALGRILVAKALARVHWPAETHKSGFAAGRDSQFLAHVGNLSPCEAWTRSSHSCEHLTLVIFGARTLDPLAKDFLPDGGSLNSGRTA